MKRVTRYLIAWCICQVTVVPDAVCTACVRAGCRIICFVRGCERRPVSPILTQVVVRVYIPPRGLLMHCSRRSMKAIVPLMCAVFLTRRQCI